MFRRSILYTTNTIINCRHASQSMLHSKIDDKSGNILNDLVFIEYKTIINFICLGIATLVMSKSPVNSLNLEFVEEIKSQLTKFKNDKIRGMILTSV